MRSLTQVSAVQRLAVDDDDQHDRRVTCGSPMEFHIDISGRAPELGMVEDAILAVDPSALVDIDPASPALRIAASVDARQLVALLNHAGYVVAPQQVTQLPSICCGGCSG
jgi:hypothetical protein